MKKKRFKENVTSYRVYEKHILCGLIFARVLLGEFFAIFAKYNPRKILQKFTSGKFDVRKILGKKIFKK